MKNQKIPILVTGGAGYIGSHVCKALFENGFLPITIDNLSLGHKKLVKWGPLIESDLQNEKTLNIALQKYKPKAIFHLAANAYVSESIKDPQKYYNNNIISTLSLLNQMIKNNIKYLVFSSSCAIFGESKTLPIKEDVEKKPISPYGKSKLMIEEILKDFETAYGLKYFSIRYFNAAGADTDIGEMHKNETHLIPLIIYALLKNKNFYVYGNDFPTKDGSAIRDFIHVKDIAIAHIKALFYLFNNNKSEYINLGSDKGFSVFEIIKEIEQYANTKISFIIKEKRVGDPPILFADSLKAKKLLGWKAKNSNIKTIISSAIDWHKKEGFL